MLALDKLCRPLEGVKKTRIFRFACRDAGFIISGSRREGDESVVIDAHASQALKGIMAGSKPVAIGRRWGICPLGCD